MSMLDNDPAIEPWHLPHYSWGMEMRNGGQIIDTYRRFPRSLREAFPHEDSTSAVGIAGPVVVPTRAPWWVRVLRACRVIA